MSERRRYVPVPYEALDLFPPNDWPAVVDLYKRAHTLRWRAYQVSTLSLVTSWGCSKRRVWDILDTLEAAELLSIERGSYRKPSKVLVFDPNGDAGHSVGHRLGHSVGQNSVDGTPSMDGCGTQTGTLSGTQTGMILDEPDLEPDLDLEDTQSDKPTERAPLELVPLAEAPDRPDDWDRLNAAYANLPSCRALSSRSKGMGKNLSRLLAAHGGLDGARHALRWMAYAKGCQKIERLRETGHDTLATIGRVEHAEGYAPLVRRWVAAGCPGDPERPAAPKAYVSPYQEDRR